MEKKELVKKLQNDIIQVTFNKINGEERAMHCTLKESIIPKTDGNNKKNNDEVLPVWDVDIGAWRSFRLDSITNVVELKPGQSFEGTTEKYWGVL